MLTLFLFATLVSAGCLNNNTSSSVRPIFIIAQGNGINITTDINVQPLASFQIASITEMTPTEEPIPAHSVCYICGTNSMNASFQNFSACIDSSNVAFNTKKTNFSVEVGNWEWCDDCPVGETNDTVKGNYLDVVFLIKTSVAETTKKGPGKAPRDSVAFGQYKLKFLPQYIVNGTNQVMASGYPLIERSDLGWSITIRFQRMDNTSAYVYQPQLTTAPPPKDGAGPKGTFANKTTMMAIGAGATLVGAVGLFFYWKTTNNKYDRIPDVINQTDAPTAPYASIEASQTSGVELEQVEREPSELNEGDGDTPDPYARADTTLVTEVKPVRLQHF